MGDEAQILLAVAGGAVFLASIAYWRTAVLGALVLLVFEGALRKWVLPEAQAALYLAKDVVLLGAYIGFFARRGLGQPPRQALPFVALLALAVAHGTLELLNPALPSFALAFVGWRAYFFYVPLLFIVPHLFASFDSLYRGLTRYALLAAAVAALGLLQFYSPVDSFINTNVQHEPGARNVIEFHDIGRVRVAGTFAFVSGFATYLLASALLLGGIIAAKGWRIKQNAILYGALTLVIAAMFATGSRGAVYSLVAAAGTYVLVSILKGDLAIGTGVRAFIGVAVFALGLWLLLPDPAGAFMHRVADTDDTLSRLASPLVEPFDILEKAGPLGFGIGAAHQAAAFLLGSAHPWWTDGLVAEAETSRVMLELGIVGFLLVFLFRILITLAALRAAFIFKSPQASTLALTLALYLGLQIFGAVIFNPTNDVLYWCAVGLLFALYRFEARARRAAAAPRGVLPLRLQRSV
jgi:hypothetical protein